MAVIEFDPGKNGQDLLACKASLLRQLQELEAREPKNMDSEAYEDWADEHEELEDLLDEIQDLLDEKTD